MKHDIGRAGANIEIHKILQDLKSQLDLWNFAFRKKFFNFAFRKKKSVATVK